MLKSVETNKIIQKAVRYGRIQNVIFDKCIAVSLKLNLTLTVQSQPNRKKNKLNFYFHTHSF